MKMLEVQKRSNLCVPKSVSEIKLCVQNKNRSQKLKPLSITEIQLLTLFFYKLETHHEAVQYGNG